jgi:hypothetical protein
MQALETSDIISSKRELSPTKKRENELFIVLHMLNVQKEDIVAILKGCPCEEWITKALEGKVLAMTTNPECKVHFPKLFYNTGHDDDDMWCTESKDASVTTVDAINDEIIIPILLTHLWMSETGKRQAYKYCCSFNNFMMDILETHREDNSGLGYSDIIIDLEYKLDAYQDRDDFYSSHLKSYYKRYVPALLMLDAKETKKIDGMFKEQVENVLLFNVAGN